MNDQTNHPQVQLWEFRVSGIRMDQLLPWAIDVGACDRVLGGCADDQLLNELFGSSLLERFHSSAWPGTYVRKGRAPMFVARLDAKVSSRMIELENSLAQWHRGLPSDLCLFRDGVALPFFFCVVHEDDAFVIGESGPPFVTGAACSVVGEAEIRRKGWIPRGPFHCTIRSLRRDKRA